LCWACGRWFGRASHNFDKSDGSHRDGRAPLDVRDGFATDLTLVASGREMILDA
jgi:hypothetical protein